MNIDRKGLLNEDDIDEMKELARTSKYVSRYGVDWDAFQVRWRFSRVSESLPIEFFTLGALRRALFRAATVPKGI